MRNCLYFLLEKGLTDSPYGNKASTGALSGSCANTGPVPHSSGQTINTIQKTRVPARSNPAMKQNFRFIFISLLKFSLSHNVIYKRTGCHISRPLAKLLFPCRKTLVRFPVLTLSKQLCNEYVYIHFTVILILTRMPFNAVT